MGFLPWNVVANEYPLSLYVIHFLDFHSDLTVQSIAKYFKERDALSYYSENLFSCARGRA
jgi:hypothetical protein